MLTWTESFEAVLFVARWSFTLVTFIERTIADPRAVLRASCTRDAALGPGCPDLPDTVDWRRPTTTATKEVRYILLEGYYV